MIEKRAVVFTRNWSPYNTGELAAFRKDKAETLVEKGLAKYAEITPVNRMMDTDNKTPQPKEQPKKARNRLVDTE